MEIKFRIASITGEIFTDDGNKTADLVEPICSIIIPMSLRRRGVETRLILGDRQMSNHDDGLIELIANARCWMDELITNQACSISNLSAKHGIHRADIGRVLPLAFLAPGIVESILAGDQPIDLTASSLRRKHDLPIAWQEQRACLNMA